QIILRRPVKHVPQIRLPRRVFQSRIFAQAVLCPGRVVEGEGNARLAADTVEGADGADLAGAGLVRLRVRVQVVQDVQQRKTVLVLGEIEQRPMRALDLFQPVVEPGVLGGRADAGRQACEHSDPGNPTQETATLYIG